MKIRVKFARKERSKYIGHLDVMRSFQRGFIRAGVKMVYSEGFSPHQKMNFAQPLGVGVTSIGDYFDAEIEDGQDLKDIKEKLNAQMGEGFDVLDIRELMDGADKAMAAVRTASYRVKVNDGKVPDPDIFLMRDEVLAIKKTKSGESEVNIRPWTKKLTLHERTFEFTVNAGNENNLKPDLLMQTLYALNGLDYDRDKLQIERTELMAEGCIPLEDYQTIA